MLSREDLREMFNQYIDAKVGNFVTPSIGKIPARCFSASSVLSALTILYGDKFLEEVFEAWVENSKYFEG